MKIFNNIQRSIFEIRNLIENIAEVRKLVYYDGVNALEQDAPTIEQTKPYFIMSPVFDVTKPPFDKNTLISISLNRANNNEQDNVIARSLVKITILTRSELWEIKNNKIRPLEISDLIIETLNNKKVSSSHKILFSSLELAILNENVNGYVLTFLLDEGSGLDGQF